MQSVLAVLWALAGLATALLLFATMARVGVRPWLGVVVVSLFVIAPETILTENWFFYTELEVLVTALALYALVRFASDRRVRDGALFASCLAVLVLTRSSFHILLMVLVLVIVWRQLALSPRELAAIAAIPLLVAGAWSVKNVVVFDSWTNSSWLGMNLSYVAHAGVSKSECRRLVADGRVSTFACDVAFRPASAYARHFPHPEHHGNAATDECHQVHWATELQRVAVHRRGVAIPARLDRAAAPGWCCRDRAGRARGVHALGGAGRRLAPTPRRPSSHLRVRRLVRPPDPPPPGRDGLERSGALQRIRRAVPLGRCARLGQLHDPRSWRVRAGRVRRSRGGADRTRCLRTVATVSAILLVWSIVVGDALDYRENNRFRVEAASLLLVLGAIGLELTIRRVATHRQRRDRPTTASPAPTP